MLDIDLESVVQVVGLAVRFERPWDAEQASSGLVQTGWEPVGSVSLPYPKRLGRGDLRLGITYDQDRVALGVTLKEWPVDWDSPDCAGAVADDYEGKIQDCRELADRIASRLRRDCSVESEAPMLDQDDFPFLCAECWKVVNVHVTLGLMHLDPDDTPIRISLYVSQVHAD